MRGNRIIGLTGHAGAGKDTCATLMQRCGFISVAFADALRREICQAWGVNYELLTDRDAKELPLGSLAIGMCQNAQFLRFAVHNGHSLYDPRSPRWLMQHWGTEFRRAQDPAYWVNQVHAFVKYQLGAGRHDIVITDVRMPNEAALVRMLGGHVVRVHRPGVPRMQPGTADHASERHEALTSDAEIHNDSTLDHLQAEINRVLEVLGQRGIAA
jgi:hypothetical protein